MAWRARIAENCKRLKEAKWYLKNQTKWVLDLNKSSKTKKEWDVWIHCFHQLRNNLIWPLSLVQRKPLAKIKMKERRPPKRWSLQRLRQLARTESIFKHRSKTLKILDQSQKWPTSFRFRHKSLQMIQIEAPERPMSKISLLSSHHPNRTIKSFSRTNQELSSIRK